MAAAGLALRQRVGELGERGDYPLGGDIRQPEAAQAGSVDATVNSFLELTVGSLLKEKRTRALTVPTPSVRGQE